MENMAINNIDAKNTEIETLWETEERVNRALALLELEKLQGQGLLETADNIYQRMRELERIISAIRRSGALDYHS